MQVQTKKFLVGNSTWNRTELTANKQIPESRLETTVVCFLVTCKVCKLNWSAETSGSERCVLAEGGYRFTCPGCSAEELVKDEALSKL